MRAAAIVLGHSQQQSRIHFLALARSAQYTSNNNSEIPESALRFHNQGLPNGPNLGARSGLAKTTCYRTPWNGSRVKGVLWPPW